MCEYLKRMSPQDTPTDDIRRWSGLAHSVVEYTGPKPFGMDGSVYLWLHERSAAQLLDMCDELDAKFSDIKNENAKLREQVTRLQADWESERDYADQMESKEKRAVAENDKLRELVRDLWEYIYVGTAQDGQSLHDRTCELGIEVD